MLDLEAKWADVLADWLDPDTQPTPDGAEDNVYTSQTPPYRAAGGPISSLSELLALPDFGVERYRRPTLRHRPAIGTKINLCTAPGIVIDALGDNATELVSMSRVWRRGKVPIIVFPTPDDLRNSFHGQDFNTIANYIDDKTSCLRVTALVTLQHTHGSEPVQSLASR